LISQFADLPAALVFIVGEEIVSMTRDFRAAIDRFPCRDQKVALKMFPE
jgi:hypothetical protein